jgi:hypothetical protein
MRRAPILMGVLLATAFVALAEPVPASAQGDCSSARLGDVPGDYRVAQTFAPQNIGNVGGAFFEVYKRASDGVGDWVVQLLAVDGSGTPTNTVLRSTTIPDSTVDEGFTGGFDFEARFNPPLDVTAGEVYAVALTRPDASRFGYGYTEFNCKPNGMEFDSNSSSGPWYAPDPDYDLRGAVYGAPAGPPPPPPLVTPPLGAPEESKACEEAKEKVKKARKKLREADTPQEKEEARKKLKKAKKKKKEACGPG